MAYSQIRRELSKILGEPTLNEKAKNGVSDFHLDSLDDVFKQMLQVKGDNAILTEDPVIRMTHDLLNKFMLYANKGTVSESFYTYFFDNLSQGRKADSLSNLRKCVEHFQLVSMLRFGSFKRAFVELREEKDIPRILSELERKRPEDIAKGRTRLELREIPASDLHLLGFVAGQEQEKRHKEVAETMERSISLLRLAKITEAKELWKSEDFVSLAEAYTAQNPIHLCNAAGVEQFETCLGIIKGKARDLSGRQTEAVQSGSANTNRYLTASKIDVYFATSMRFPMDFIRMHEFVNGVMTSPSINELNLTHFDPTMSYTPDPRTKGLIECLMLRRAKVAIYVASEKDSFGKDSELATMLVQGKPAIVYVPAGEKYDTRAKLFKEIHPLSMQVALQSGVAHGVLVVRTPEECARLVYALFTNTLDLRVVDGEETNKADKNYYLVEKISDCPLRIVSKDLLLTNCFWNLYFKND